MNRKGDKQGEGREGRGAKACGTLRSLAAAASFGKNGFGKRRLICALRSNCIAAHDRRHRPVAATGLFV